MMYIPQYITVTMESVTDYKKIYELSKLNRDINKAIDDTELIGGK
mgnify:CR=1 FL=1